MVIVTTIVRGKFKLFYHNTIFTHTKYNFFPQKNFFLPNFVTQKQLFMEEQQILNIHNKDEYAPAHTAEHLLNQTMIRLFGCERSKNAHIERKKSKINYTLQAQPTQEQIDEVEKQMNHLIQMDLPVKYEFVQRDNVPDDVRLDRLPEDASETLRLVRIGDYDVCPCIGTHVTSTAEIGTFHINSTSWNEETKSFRIVFKVI